ncbi:enoyl-CoA hydratase [Sodiomyces alkalinus F11]|uniref:Enoyl-CoA hydratase n=1 Tax=Sodiomyces alkalinus (strain CBS 110278 / VKM F-3762 / F11) TaxID=1314773 RepID=A0A3N2PYH2_SODAK|nr:enoyl-CoA hydratase [Sodiomyces alkalinus F11]ROT39547.1 enoyl-CoA hydratase [Sodiomyces alkalinus F11]
MASTTPLPESYNTYQLPEIKLSHHPASSPHVTPVILVILNRPEARNAFTEPMTDSLETAFTVLGADPRVKAIVLTGCDPTNRTFCVGMDLALASTGRSYHFDKPLRREAYRDGGGRVSLAIHRCPKPVVAAINGSAVGVGITMTLPATIRVASNRAKIGFVFGRRGLNMEACSSFFLPRLIGTSRAMRLVATGEVFPATREDVFGGLFAEVVDPDQVVPRALAIAEDVAANVSGVAFQLSKELMYRGPGSPEEAHLLESAVFFDMIRGADSKEGIRSFREKRAPDFRASLEKDPPAAYPWWEEKDAEAKM